MVDKNNVAKVMHEIIGHAMAVHSEYHPGLLESAYEAALCHLLNHAGLKVERQANLPLYWHETRLEQCYRMDLVVEDNIIIELKAVNNVDSSHRHQLFNYMNITHVPYGIIINFGGSSLYSECYQRDPQTGDLSRLYPRPSAPR